MNIEEQLRVADPVGRITTPVLDEPAKALAREVAEVRNARARFRIPLMIVGIVGCLGLAGGAGAIASPDLMPWARPYQGDLRYERTIPIETGDLACRVIIGAEPDPSSADATTVQRFEEATTFLESIDIDELDRLSAETKSTWAKARAREYAKPDPDEAYIDSTFVGQIQEEFEARGFLGAGIALQAEYGCEAQQ